MESTTAIYLVRGARISENLEHHKASDVVRILEEKGFKKEDNEAAALTAEKGFSEAAAGTTADVQCYVHKDGSDNGSRTVIFFDEGNFVRKEGGVSFYDA